ncbi:T6SS phospholipase effector Tle1-like catalytic domain-containing protein [Actinobacillus equuli]|uniref:T6SS phospholipase effector Tle1-like catalytic domain-containing protein n=1 Tax=Actinobacillus equuli TaxID=718 RepID=UPI0024434A6D|nr:DUF2235 domain-containing protein [Actinobacillus equuli]WGE85926.1 DUF2235 domain-containing protein [Actinobacillus equuli subsp. haemolyticus]
MNCKVVRIGVFFDGTGNNLTNDEAGRSKNGVSNIGKLFRLYSNNDVLKGDLVTECLIYTCAIYIEGVGTINNHDDYTTGGAAGELGAQRIRRAIRQVAAIREQFSQSEYKCYIDVFGFSRGAAMARDFINSMYRTPNSRLKVTFKFVGLFDTVGSFGLAGNHINYKPITDEDTEADTIQYEVRGKIPPSEYYEPYNFNLSPQSAEKIVHFVALDEYRENFPLSDTQGAGLTYYFIGAHSDIGGGYARIENEKLFNYSKETNLNQAEKNLETPQNGIKLGDNWQCIRAKHTSDYSVNVALFPTLCRGARRVTDDLQKVALVAMYNLALKENVPFIKDIPNAYQDIPFKLDDTNVLSNWAEELVEYYKVATTNISSLKSTIGGYTSFNNQTEPHIRTAFHLNILAKYAHNSSGTPLSNRTVLPPIGFRHREFLDTSDNMANKARRIRNNPLPIRESYANHIGRAIVRNDAM